MGLLVVSKNPLSLSVTLETRMRIKLALALAAVLTLAGCTAAPVAAPMVSPSPTPTIDLGPVELSKEEAATYYLRLVCQPNTAGQALQDAIVAGEDEFLNGGEPDPSAAKAAASEKLRIDRLVIEVFDDPYFVWPKGVAEQIAHIRSSFIADQGSLSTLANATRYADVYYYIYPAATAEQLAAPQEIRYQLGLDADTVSSCAGYESELEVAHAEMTERNVELAKWAEPKRAD
jgi:hypothetical protein